MSSEKFIEIIVEHGYEIEEYENHYSARSSNSVNVVVTIPKATYIVKSVIDYIKQLLNIWLSRENVGGFFLLQK